MEVQTILPGFDAHMKPPRVTVADIQREVAEFFGIAPEEMQSQRRFRGVARPRQVAMFFAKELTPHSLMNIGRLFGDRDHKTVMHAIARVEQLTAADPEFAAKVRECGRRL